MHRAYINPFFLKIYKYLSIIILYYNTVMVILMSTYSHSRLSTFEQCRYKYKLAYIDKVKAETPKTIEAFMGDLVHRALHKLYYDLGFLKLDTLKELLSFYNKLWDKEYSSDILIVKGYDASNYKAMGEKYLTEYYNHYKPFDDIRIIGLETQELLKLSDDIHYHVRIDKLGFKDSTYYVCDYKTNSYLKTQEEADIDRQLAMYSVWVHKKFPDAKKVVLKWHMLAFDKEVTSSRTPAQLKQLQKEALLLIHDIEHCREFPTNVSPLCDYCVYKSICPSFSHAVVLEEKDVQQFKKDSGVKMVDKLAELQLQYREFSEAIEKLKADIVKYSIQHNIDVVYGSNKKASVKGYDKAVFPEDKEELIKLLHKKGLYKEFSTVNYLKLGPKILKGEMDKAFESMIKREKGYRITLSNKESGK